MQFLRGQYLVGFELNFGAKLEVESNSSLSNFLEWLVAEGVKGLEVHLLESHLEYSSNYYQSLPPTKDPDYLVLNCWSCFGHLNC